MHNEKDLDRAVCTGYLARREDRLADSSVVLLEGVRKAAIEANRDSLAEAFYGLAQAER